MNHESWRIRFQSSEQAAQALWKENVELREQLMQMRSGLRAVLDEEQSARVLREMSKVRVYGSAPVYVETKNEGQEK